MSADRIAALIIGLCAIGFGLMLLPWAGALRRRMLKKGEPEPVVRVLTDASLPIAWRHHVLPWLFILLGTALFAAGLQG
jgi:hypothetical protein